MRRATLGDPNPVLFVENVRLYGRRADVDLGAIAIPFGRARSRGRADATVVALSGMVDEALVGRRPARGAQGVSVEVIDPRRSRR